MPEWPADKVERWPLERLVPYARNARTHSEAAMRAGRLRHDGNPVLEWCLGNVVGKADRRGNLYPTKQRTDQKIDAAVALMMAIGRAMSDEPDAGLDGFLSNPLVA
jgi:phage terminase large subunit-like protein